MSQEEQERIDVKRGRYNSISLYEVSARELELIERGSTNSLVLNIGLFLLSAGLSFLVALLSVDFFYEEKDDLLITFVIFLVVCGVCLLGGIICMIIWYRSRGDFESVISSIKERMREDNNSESGDDTSVG